MNGLAKSILVALGYASACFMAGGVVYVYQLLTESAITQASSGMHAFSDLLLFIGVFFVLALFPTGLALYYLLRTLRKS